jgi:hypothetical protein
MRFVTNAGTVRKTLKDGSWIEIKKELTVGEDRRYRTAGMTKMRAEKEGDVSTPTIEVDFAHMAVARVEAYLVEWSAKQKVNRASIEALDKVSFEEIDKVIQEHIADLEAEAKNAQSAPTESSIS